MSVTINGTTGLAGVDGSAGTPAVQGSDTNTGIFFPAADTVGVTTGGSERMRVDSSGNVGIGTASPSGKLDVATDANAVAYLTYVRNANAGSSAYAISGWGNNSSSNAGQVAISSTANTGYGGGGDFIFLANTGDMTLRTTTAKPMTFYTNSAERMRIDSSGNLLVGTTSQYGSERLRVYQSGDSETANLSNASNNGTYPLTVSNRGTTTDRRLINFRQGSSETNCGAIYYNGSAVVYATSSDYRLKENIVDLSDALASVLQLKPRAFTWKDGQIDDTGFIAHELAEVFPKAVQGTKDAIDADGNPVYQGIDTSFLVATLTAAIQEQQALITALTARITALEAKP
jgi:hypothetical protein